MKRLDELTQEDLLEEHDRMMGVVEDGSMEGLDYFSDGTNPLAMLEAKELYDELDRLEREEERASESGRQRSTEAVRQPHYWKDKRTPIQLRSRVWRKASANQSQLAKN